ncbi:MAG: hypothetical protein ACTHOI_05555 [Sphingomicrobium sp.]
MATQLRRDQCSSFEVRTCPDPEILGRALENNEQVPGAVLRLRFGDDVASLALSDLWSACCELRLQAELAREGKLDHFVVDAEQVFEVSYAGDLLYCIFSCEHVFAVLRQQFAAALENAVEAILAGTSCPRLMHIGAGWGASAIRALPYSFRFSDSELV